MLPKSHYTKAILWWFGGVCFLALFLFAGCYRNDWNGTCAGLLVVFFVCGCRSYRYSKTGGKDIQITDSILLNVPIDNFFEIVETHSVEVWAIVESCRDAKAVPN